MACHQGAVSASKLGYKNVFVLPAGISGWKKAGKPVEKGASLERTTGRAAGAGQRRLRARLGNDRVGAPKRARLK